ncbi:MAG: glycosyltransferase family 2 protein [Armatimonadia bacterium]
MRKLAICIVNWNTRDLLDRCLQSIHETTTGDLASGCAASDCAVSGCGAGARTPPAVIRDNQSGGVQACGCRHPRALQSDTDTALDVETIVVDNASADGSTDMVRTKHPWARLIANDDNLFYAAANNQALRATEAHYKLLLNPDIIVHPGSLQALLRFLDDHPQAGAVAPRLRGLEAEVQHTCRSFPDPDVVIYEALGLSRLFPHSRTFGKYRMTWWDYGDTRAVDQPMASAFLVRDEALQAVGLFDEQFPMFFNDVDLCRRLWDGGWEVWFTPDAEMTHLGGAATRQVRRAMIIASHEGFLRYYRKHYRGRTNPLAYHLAVALLRVGEWVRLLRATKP